jgi:flagellar hook-basal body complex protein FliE
MQIAPLSNLPPITSVPNAGGGSAPAPNSFGDMVSNFVQQTNQDQVQSDQAVSDLLQGKTDNVQDVVLAAAKAEMSFQLFMEIRNRLISAYNDLMRMQF